MKKIPELPGKLPDKEFVIEYIKKIETSHEQEACIFQRKLSDLKTRAIINGWSVKRDYEDFGNIIKWTLTPPKPIQELIRRRDQRMLDHQYDAMRYGLYGYLHPDWTPYPQNWLERAAAKLASFFDG